MYTVWRTGAKYVLIMLLLLLWKFRGLLCSENFSWYNSIHPKPA